MGIPRAAAAARSPSAVRTSSSGKTAQRDQRLLDGEARPGRREGDLLSLVRDPLAPAGGASHLCQELLCERHQISVVGIGLVELQHRELGVVVGRDPLVAEVAVDLVHPFQPPDHAPLQVQLRRDAEVEREIQRVVMRDERARRRSPGDRLHHRRLDLQEAARVQEAAHLGDDPRPAPERLDHGRVGEQIHVALSIANLDVAQAVPLVRQRAQGFRQQRQRRRLDGKLPGLGPKEAAVHADEVADVQTLEEPVCRFPHAVQPHVDLDPACPILEMGERGLPVPPQRHDATRHRHGRRTGQRRRHRPDHRSSVNSPSG